MPRISYEDLRILFCVVQLLFMTSSATSAVKSSWCEVEESYDAYQMALRQLNVAEMRQQELNTLIDLSMKRAGCQQLLGTSTAVNCSQCVRADQIYNVLDLSAATVLTEATFSEATTIITSFLSNLTLKCHASQSLDWDNLTMEHFYHEFFDMENIVANHTHEEGHHAFLLGQLEFLMRQIASSYIPGDGLHLSFTADERSQYAESTCSFQPIRTFSSKDVTNLTNPVHPDEGFHEDELGRMNGILLMKLVTGECISEVEDHVAVSEDFVRNVFRSYGEQGTCLISMHGLEEIAAALLIGGSSHDHEHEHASGHGDMSGHEDVHKRRKRSTLSDSSQGDVTNYDVEQQADDHDHGEHDHDVDVNTTCLPVTDLLASFGFGSTAHPDLTKTDFMRLCPSLIQQATQGCKNVPVSQILYPSTAEVYGYGTLSVVIISTTSFFGLIIVRWQNNKIYRYLMAAMFGLAVGSLLGDGLLHLVPHALGLHDHSSHAHEHDSSEIVVEVYLWKMLCACGSIWFYYNLQLALRKLGHVWQKRKSSVSSVEGIHHAAFTDNSACKPRSAESAEGVEASSGLRSTRSNSLSSTSEELKVHPSTDQSVAWMIVLGDGVHNFADGLAIGAAFSSSLETGWATTLAIFAHELPHEFGDIAVMFSAGWSTTKVALAQLASQSTAFVGLYIGIVVSEDSEDAQQWIFAVTTGIFLYIALADIMPELLEYFNHYNSLYIFIASNIGIAIGFTCMMVIAVFEEHIAF